MPELREWLLLVLVAGAALLAIAWPLLGPRPAETVEDPELEARLVRYRVALESLRDVEADHRAGLLDEASYAAQRSEAEARAAATLGALEGVAAAEAPAPRGGGPRVALAIATVVVGLLLLGFALPHPVGIGEATVTNQALAQAQAREAARRAQIAALLDRLAADPTDTAALSDLADAYLAGASADDRRRGAVALLALIGLEPENASAYQRLITAYINAGDWADARSATDSYAAVVGEDDPDVPFFRGLVALRGDGDQAEAVRQFDRFLELAPDDPRTTMIRSLRAEAAGELESPSP
jgi:cytochrome c-type biogenesis protein CcmI